MRKTMILNAASALVLIHAFNNPGWKLDADGKLELDADGNPQYVNAAGQVQSVKGDTIATLNAEAKAHRTRAETAEKALEPFKGLDAEAAKKAIETIGKIDAKTLIDAGEVDRVRDTIKAEYTGQLTEAQNGINERDAKINSLLIDRVFDGSEFVRDSVAVPVDMFRATFKDNFKVENGEIVTYDRSGNRLLSKVNQGEYAKPDEALQLLTDAHPQKNLILKADAGAGTGSGGGGGARPGSKTIKRADFEGLDPAKQAEIATKGEIQIVD